MAISKITTTPTPLSVVDKINEVIDGKLDTTAKAASASTADSATKATSDASGNNIANTYATKASAITGLSVSGKTITYTKGNGTTGTITTQDTNTTYSEATTSAAGLMSAADKTKLNGIATGANAYSLPTASSSTLGGIKVGSGLSISNGVLSSSGGSAAVSAYKIPYATCSTATSTAAKVATITNGVSFELVAGTICIITFTNKCNYITASATLNINSTGAKPLRPETDIWNRYETSSYSNDKRMGGAATKQGLVMYSGSKYITTSTFEHTTYMDYSD